MLVHHECALQMLVQDVDAGSCPLVPTRSTAVETNNICEHEFVCIQMNSGTCKLLQNAKCKDVRYLRDQIV